MDGFVYPFFHDACFVFSLFADDPEYIDAITKTSILDFENHLQYYSQQSQ